MKRRAALLAGKRALSIRRAQFADIPAILRLIERAIESGCRHHYDERQRRSVFFGYASTMFIEAQAPFETRLIELDGRLAGTAQLDPRSGLLRALFVDAGLQGQGIGRTLLDAIESCARANNCRRVYGAMSLNAVPFYRQAGFREERGPQTFRGLQAQVPVLWMEKPL